MKLSALVLFCVLAAASAFAQVPPVFQGVYVSTGTIDGREFDKPFLFFVEESTVSLDGTSIRIVRVNRDAGNFYITLDGGIEVIYYQTRHALDVIDMASRRVIVTLRVVRQNGLFLT